jgi:hypothetical protein
MSSVLEPLSSNRGNGKLSLATKLPTYCLHFAFDKTNDPCHIVVANLKLQRWRAGGRLKNGRTCRMTIQAHIASLEKKHGALEEELESILASPSSDDREIADLKRRKLRLKDELQRLRASTRH